MILRPDTSDRAVHRQVYAERIYAHPCPVEPTTILDLGAYTGISTRWFQEAYPDAHVIAVEPDREHARLVWQNAPGAEVHAVAVGETLGRAPLYRPEGGAWRTTTCVEIGGVLAGSVRRTTVDLILAGRQAEIVKIDIEGAEVEVFRAGGEWLENVRLLFVEQHDRFRTGCTKAVRDALDATGRDYTWTPNGGSNAVVTFP